MQWDLPTTFLVFPAVTTHCCGLMFACCSFRLCWFSVFLWPSFGCVSCNPLIALSLSLSLWHLFCLSVYYINCVPQPLFFLTLQVIYKKFNLPCPFVDFALNGTASLVNVSATDPGGDEDPSCIPKMANLNSQVGLCMPLTLRVQIHLHCHGYWLMS